MIARMAEAHAKAAATSQAVADAYRALAEVVQTDPRFAILREVEVDRFLAEATEYNEDAEHEREHAIEHGYVPR